MRVQISVEKFLNLHKASKEKIPDVSEKIHVADYRYFKNGKTHQ